MDFKTYMQQILSVCSEYLKEHTEQCGLYAEQMLPDTRAYLGTLGDDDAAVHGVLGVQYLVCALYYTENEFYPDKCAEHARNAQQEFCAYLDAVGDTLDEKQKAHQMLYIQRAVILQAYCALQNDEFEKVLALLSDQPATALVMALCGTASTRLAWEVEGFENHAYIAYLLLSQMDEIVEAPFGWLFEEDTFRAAYSFLTLLVTDTTDRFPNETRIPQSNEQALKYAEKIYMMVQDEQQKEWARQDLEVYRSRM